MEQYRGAWGWGVTEHPRSTAEAAWGEAGQGHWQRQRPKWKLRDGGLLVPAPYPIQKVLSEGKLGPQAVVLQPGPLRRVGGPPGPLRKCKDTKRWSDFLAHI